MNAVRELNELEDKGEFRSAHDLQADFAKLIQGLLVPATV